MRERQNADVSAAPDRRKLVRVTAVMGAGLRRQGETAQPATIFDISDRGCKIEALQPLSVGAHIWLRARALPAAPILARVVWVQDFLAGCEFVIPLPDAVLDRLHASD
jgi:hypothetical protein